MLRTLLIVSCIVSPATSLASTMLFDFGRTDLQTAGNWNNVIRTTTTRFSVRDDTSAVVGTGLEITDPFFDTGEPSQIGTEAPAGDASGFPINATDDYLFGHTTNVPETS